MPVPVITVEQMRAWESATWATGVSEDAVMRRAGAAVARHVVQLTRPGDAVLVVAGRGHNGDDAVYAADHLPERTVEVMRVAEPRTALPELREKLAARPALVLDGLFGIGLNRSLAPEWLEVIRALNESHLAVLAVDVPSGLNAQTGEAMPEAIRARRTVTLAAIKTGLLEATAWPFVGRLEVEPEIGLVPCPVQSELQFIQASDFDGFPPPRLVSGHKGTFGHLIVVAGSKGYHGAAVLAARGAQRAQPGLITLCVPEDVYLPVAAQSQAVMVRAFTGEPVFPENPTAVLIGPGLAAANLPEALHRFVQQLWQEAPWPVIVDASALAWLPEDARAATAPRVITPHPGEAARLLRVETQRLLSNRVEAVRRLSKHFGGCDVVLKGHHTLVGRAEGELHFNSSGNPHLAQGGSGDLLGGFIAGFLAQPAWQQDVARTIRHAVWQHGAAADRLQRLRPGWTVEELAEELAVEESECG